MAHPSPNGSDPTTPAGATTALPAAARDRPRAGFDRSFSAAYPRLGRIARSLMWRESGDHTLQPTALVSETYLRLLRDPSLSAGAGVDVERLLGVAARSMRQVLIDHARARDADKRGAGAPHLTLSAAGSVASDPLDASRLEALDEAIATLERGNLRQATVVQLRYFAGLSIDETAQAMGLSAATVKREWTLARLWLMRSLEGAADAG